MKNKKIQTPHDKFFKENLSDSERAKDFILSTFPKEIIANLDLDSLKLENNSYIDEALKEVFSDIVYLCNTHNQKILITLLFEHKSRPVDFPHIQLLSYLLNIWKTNQKQKKPLSPVLPIIFYHGPEKWDLKPFHAYFPPLDDVFQPFIPDFKYLLTDLSSYSNQEIKDKLFHNTYLKISMLMFKNIFEKPMDQALLEDILKLGELYYKEEKGLQFLESLILYFFSAAEKQQPEKIIDVINKISKEGGKKVMTIEQILLKRGKEIGEKRGEKRGEKKGEKRGEKRGKIETAKKLYRMGLSLDQIVEATGLGLDEIKKIILE